MWIAAALGANLLLATIVLVVLGAGIHGTATALRVTARVSFLWFWAAYIGSALTTLFGRAFLPLKQRGREFGLAFATALLVHLCLVSWLCWIGAAPAVGVFVLFGTAAVFTYLLAICSVGNFQSMLGPRRWPLLRMIGMNFILCAFFKDFARSPLFGDFWHAVEYVPFAMMAIGAALLRLAAWRIEFRVQEGNSVRRLQN
jgi:hypothetical protein